MAERYQREIEEILEQTGTSADPKQPAKSGGMLRRLGRSRGSGSGGRARRITPLRVFMASIALLLTALLMNSLAPGLQGLFAWSGLLLFIVAYALFFTHPGKPIEKRWRGQVVGDSPPQAPRRLRLPRWLRR